MIKDIEFFLKNLLFSEKFLLEKRLKRAIKKNYEDVEGHEKEVIDGSKEIINKNKPTLLVEIEERHTNRPVNDTIKFINDLGYNSYYVHQGSFLSTNELENINSENNFIFLSKN